MPFHFKPWRISLSVVSIWLVAIICLLIDFDLNNWNKPNRVIEHDVHSYYGYLPAYFIYDDIKVNKSNYAFSNEESWFWTVKTKDGKNVFKMSLGLSILYLPFFSAAHLFTVYSDYLPNGFSEPYKLFLLLSSIFYLIIGLEFSRKTLRYLGLSDPVIAISILLTGLGTNLLCYSSQSAPMPHVYNYFLFAIFVYLSIKWNNNPGTKQLILLALIFGLITLIRPSNAVIILFFIVYNFKNLRENYSTVQLIKKSILFTFFTFIVFIPQLLYWKFVTGHLVYYSYNEETFFFFQPKIIDGLFSFRKGWLIYTPIMIFSIYGLFLLGNKNKNLRNGIIVFMLLNIYIIFSWWCWWYGGTFGQRPLIESYSLLIIGMAFFIDHISKKKLRLNIAFYSVSVFFIWLNITQMYQFEYHILHWDGMNRKLYLNQFGKNYKTEQNEKLISWPDYEMAKKGKR